MSNAYYDCTQLIEDNYIIRRPNENKSTELFVFIFRFTTIKKRPSPIRDGRFQNLAFINYKRIMYRSTI